MTKKLDRQKALSKTSTKSNIVQPEPILQGKNKKKLDKKAEIKKEAIQIPERLRNFNFVLIDEKGDGKKPKGLAWQKKIIKYNHPDLLKHIEKGNNYGVQMNGSSVVINGKGYFLIVVDFDKKEIQDKIISQLPETFTTSSGSQKNCVHLWFGSDNNKAFKIKDEKLETLIDVLGAGNQVIAPPSRHKSGSVYSIVKDIPFAFIPYSELQAILIPHDRSPKKTDKPKKEYKAKGLDDDLNSKIINSIPLKKVLEELGIDTSKNPTSCFFHSSIGGKCLGFNENTCHCFHCEGSWNAYSLIREAKKLTDKETFEWFAEKAGLMNELLISRKEYKKAQPQENHDLKTFIFDENQIIEKKVFSSHLLDNNSFGFGVLLPRMEDIKDKSGNIIAQKQVWRPVIVCSNNGEPRGLVVSKWMENEYKINYECLPVEMKLRWELKRIRNYLDEKSPKINGKELFESIKKEYEYYSFFREKNWYDINVLWDIGTYFHQLFSAFPLKEERGLKETGKTKTMVVSSQIALNATDIMTNPSEATLFRETENTRPAKYIDEAETLFRITKNGIEQDLRIELINASYTRNGVVPRQEKLGGVYVTKWYHVYSPTRIGSINGLFGATESRAITQIHTKAPDSDKRGERDPEDDKDDVKWKKIRNDCYLWALQNWKLVRDEYLNFSVKSELKKRDLQLWKPLIVIAKVMDENLMNSIIKFAEKLAKQKKLDSLSEGTLEYKLLESINKILLKEDVKDNRIYLETIRDELDKLYPYKNKKGEIESRDKGYNRTISSRLDKLGFKDLKDKDDKGAYYELTKNIFDEIVTPITSDFTPKLPKLPKEEDKVEEKTLDFASISSKPSVIDDKKNLEPDDNLTELTKEKEKKEILPDDSDANDDNDDGLTAKKDIFLEKCAKCGSTDINQYADCVVCFTCGYKEKLK